MLSKQQLLNEIFAERARTVLTGTGGSFGDQNALAQKMANSPKNRALLKRLGNMADIAAKDANETEVRRHFRSVLSRDRELQDFIAASPGTLKHPIDTVLKESAPRDSFHRLMDKLKLLK